MKVFNIIFMLLFIFSAALQYNDPDPYLWMPIYLYGALICWLAIKKRFYPIMYLAGIMVYLAYAIILLVKTDGVADWFSVYHSESLVQTMKAEKPWIENTREFGGLLILIVVFAVNYFYAKRKKLIS